jgi:hypothetical protein
LSPILVRPVREQLEHDRVIRQLQKDLSRRKIEVSINPGAEQNVAVGSGTRREFPDAVLFSADKARKMVGIIEVETGESVNHLEAMAQWAHYARLKAPFHLYVPMASVDVARRLTVDHQIAVAEIHSYHQIGDLVRFGSAYRSGTAPKLPDDPLPPEPVQKTKPVASPVFPQKKTTLAAPARPAPAKSAPVIGKSVAAPAKPVVTPAKTASPPPKTTSAPPKTTPAPAKPTPASAKPTPPSSKVAMAPARAMPVKPMAVPAKPVAPVKATPVPAVAKGPAKPGKPPLKLPKKSAPAPVARKVIVKGRPDEKPARTVTKAAPPRAVVKKVPARKPAGKRK